MMNDFLKMGLFGVPVAAISALIAMNYTGGKPAQASIASPSHISLQNTHNAASIEQIYWQSVQNSSDSEQLKSYIKKFPNGVFADLALAKIIKIEKNKVRRKSVKVQRQNKKIRRKKRTKKKAAIVRASAQSGVSCHSLWVKRNAIFKRNGYCFKSKRAIRYFGNANCWTNSMSLGRGERNRVNRIRRQERRHGC